MHAPTADAAEFTPPPPRTPEPADQMAERAAWALALAAWMHAANAGLLPQPAPEPAPALPDQTPAEWWHMLPHASDWWM